MLEEMAIMKNVSIGMYDRGEPGLMFECVQEGCVASQFLPWDKTGELFKAAGFSSVTQFEGKPCIVEKSGNGGMTNMMVFQRMARV